MCTLDTSEIARGASTGVELQGTVSLAPIVEEQSYGRIAGLRIQHFHAACSQSARGDRRKRAA